MSDEFPTFGGTGVRDGVPVPREREELRGVLAGLLGAEPDELTDDDNLVGLGLDSVAVMRLVGRWRRAGVDVTYERLLATPTLLGWLEALSAGAGQPAAGEEWPGEVVVAPAATDPAAPFPLTPVQHAYWIGRHEAQVLGGVGCHGYFEFDAPAESTVDPARLERAVRALVRRHGMLRARVLDDGTQVITPDGAWPGLTVHDLRDVAPEEAGAELLRVRESAAHRRMDVRAGEVFDVVLSLAPGVTRLSLDVDLIVADVLSIQVLMTDLATAYETDAELPVIPHSFPRYLAERDQDPERRRALAAARAHWSARLDTMPATGPQLPLALDPAQVKVPRFHRRLTRLAPEGWARLSRRCAEHHLTPSMVLATAFSAVLGRWSADPRFLLNIPLFDRQHDDPAVGELVADFTNLLVLEVDTAGTGGFADRARAVSATFASDVSHAVHSAVDVLRELGRTRGTPASAPVVFASSLGGEFVGPAFRDRFGDLSWMVSQTPQVWLDHQLYEQAGGLLLTWDTVEELFPEGVVGDMFAAYERLVGWLAAADSDWSEPGPELMPAAQDEVRAQVNDTTGPVPEGLLHQGFLAKAERSPDAVAVIDVDGPATYAEVLAGAVAVAAALGDGVAGSVVGVLADKSRYQVSAVLGVLLAGAAYLPLAAGQPAVRRDAILADAGVSAVVTTAGDRPDDLPSHLAVVEVDLLAPAGHAVPAPIARPGELAYLIYTSGSTGAPKGVMTTHRAALNTVVDVNARFGVGEGDRVLGLAGLGFDLSVYDLFGPPAAGAALVLPDPDRRADPSHWAELVAEHGVTLWNSVPAQLQMLDNYLDYEDVDVSSLRLALLSGDWIPVPLPDSIRAKVPGLEVVSLGGATEAAIWSVLFPVGEIDRAWRSIPYGTPMLNQDLAVFDTAFRPCPDWVTGELYIGGAGVAEGYLGDAERTAERFVVRPQDGRRYYRTGDLARYRPDGVLEFLGRADNQVKIRGHRIELGEVEYALRTHPGVASATVVVDGDRPMERTLAAFVTPGPRAGGADEAERARAWEAATSVVEDSGRAVEFGRAVERAQLSAMADVLAAAGLFTGGSTHTAEEVAVAVAASPGHHGLIRRWLVALESAGLLTRAEEGYRDLVLGDTEQFWAEVESLREDRVCTSVRFEHMRASAKALPELLRDEVQQLRLLFPEGSLERADAMYSDTLPARHLNSAAAHLVAALAGHRDRLRVLELGAGVGATAKAVLDALDGTSGCAVDYLFTDVSPFFLNEARGRFGDRANLRYATVDLNADPRGQGMEPSGFDVVIAANALHNAVHVGEALERVRTLLAPAGWVVLIEGTRESADLLTLLGFLVKPDTPDGDWLDERRGRDQVLLSEREWTEALTAAGAEVVLAVPSAGGGDQHLLAARFKADRSALDAEEVIAHAAATLPEHMVPARAQVVEELPLTGNGKLDHATLRTWLRPAHGGGQAEGEPPRDELEQAVADVFAELLRRPHLGRDQDFFAEGGDSLLVTQAVNRLRAEVGGAAELSFDSLLRVVLDRATPAAVALAVREVA